MNYYAGPPTVLMSCRILARELSIASVPSSRPASASTQGVAPTHHQQQPQQQQQQPDGEGGKPWQRPVVPRIRLADLQQEQQQEQQQQYHSLQHDSSRTHSRAHSRVHSPPSTRSPPPAKQWNKPYVPPIRLGQLQQSAGSSASSSHRPAHHPQQQQQQHYRPHSARQHQQPYSARDQGPPHSGRLQQQQQPYEGAAVLDERRGRLVAPWSPEECPSWARDTVSSLEKKVCGRGRGSSNSGDTVPNLKKACGRMGRGEGEGQQLRQVHRAQFGQSGVAGGGGVTSSCAKDWPQGFGRALGVSLA